MLTRQYTVYILTNRANKVLYVGITNNLKQRVHHHKEGKGSTFTSKYKINKLVYYEVTDEIHGALFREKQLKAGSRQKKLDLINKFNPQWKDLYDEI